MDPLALVGKVGNIVAAPALEASKEWVNKVRNCDHNVDIVLARHHELKNGKDQVVWDVDVGKNLNQEVVPEVKEWIEDVDKFMIGSKKEYWEERQKGKDARRKAEQCCFGFLWSPRYRHNLSQKAEEQTVVIVEKLNKKREWGQRPVTRPTLPLKLSSSTSSAFCVGLKSREKQVKDILKVLRNDKLNRFGIYGMGGSGKTTLIQELARQTESDKMFNAIIIAEISQYPDYNRIQDQIADRINYTALDQYHTIEERALNLGNRLKEIKRGKRSNDDEAQHGTTKGEKVEDDEKGGEAKKNPTKINNKGLTSKKEDALDGERKGLQRDKKKDIIEEDGSDKHGDDGEKDGRVKAKKSNEEEKKKSSEEEKKKSSEEDKQGRIDKSGKLLVILDNTWKKLDLHLIGIPYELEKDLGCKIIVISRSEDVCKAMDTSDSCIFKVGDLDDDEAEHLFRDRVGKIVDKPEYKEISRKLLKKCSRLPLTINVLADRLKNQTLSVWERSLKQLEKPVQGETQGILGDTYSIIEMSYNYLGNNDKKMFFLLCCLFPPGASVHIHDLLKYGIGMSLFQYVNSIVEAIEQAYKWADDLKSLSLLKDVDVKKGVIYIHDDVREAGKSFAAKGDKAFHVGAIPKWLQKESYEKYTVISMMSNSSYEYLSSRSLPKLQLLRSLGLSCSKLDKDYFLGMKNLKVLDMSKSDIETLPSSLDQLENLQTLLLEYCSLKDITEVSKLVKLQVLSFRESTIRRLPKEMKALVELKLLIMTNCDKLKEIPCGIFSHLKQLEGLYMEHSFSDWAICGDMASLSELTSLPLQVLEITIQNISQLPNGDFPSLDLSSYKIDIAVSTPPEQENLFSRDLQLQGVHARALIKEGWKPLINKTESLYLKEIKGLKNVAPYLGEYGWQDLKSIMVSECPHIDYIISKKALYQSSVFPKLEVLRLDELPALEAIYHGKSPPDLFSNLQELTLSYLNKLCPSAISVKHATKLKVIEVNNCDNLESIFFAPDNMQFSEHEDPKSIHKIHFPCLEKLILTDLEALKGLFANANPNDSKRNLFPKQVVFPVLDKIKLDGLGKIEQLWDFTTSQEFGTTFPELRTISLAYMYNLKVVWSAKLCKTSFIIEKIKKLKINDCDCLEFVCPPSVGFYELELLRIISCEELKQVIAIDEVEDELDVNTINSKKKKMLMVMMAMERFPKLLDMDLIDLPKLTYFYQGMMKMEFPALKNLYLDDLPELKTLITKVKKESKGNKKKEYTSDDDILFNIEANFPCLEDLYAENMICIEGLWDIGINQFCLKFPKLLSLSLVNMEKLKNIWTKGIIATKRNKEFNGDTWISVNLKEIEIQNCISLESLLPPSGAYTNTSVEVKVTFPKLETIEVNSSEKFKCILEGKGNLEFPSLKTVNLKNLPMMVALTKLEKLETPNSEGVDNNDDDLSISLFNGKSYVPSLEELQLEDLPKVDKLWSITSSDEFSRAFASLRVLEIDNLPQLKYVWSDGPTEDSHYFGILESLIIMNCDKIESVFASSTKPSNTPQLQPQKLVSFPKLQKLILTSLESFKSFFPGCSNMEFQALKELVINKLPLVKSLVKLSKMEVKSDDDDDDEEEEETEEENEEDEKEKEDEEEGEEEKENEEDEKEKDNEEEKEKESVMEEGSNLKGDPESEDISMDTILFKGNVDFSSLEELKIKYMSGLESIYETEEEHAAVSYSSIFPKVKTLHLTGGNEVKLKQLPEGMLKVSSLAIRRYQELRFLVSSSGEDALAKSIAELANLTELVVNDCESLEELFRVEVDQHETVKVSSLKVLKISGLSQLKSAQWQMLPNLESLKISRSFEGKKFLFSTTEVAEGGLSLQSLESIKISNCADMEAIIVGDDTEVLFPKLKEVKVKNMMSLVTFSSTSSTISLPSLESIAVIRCHFVRSFSNGSVVIPQLNSLEVDYETVVLGDDLNTILKSKCDSDSKSQVAINLPRKVTSKLHNDLPILLGDYGSYDCNECEEEGSSFAYVCGKCSFYLHPYCALNESQLTEIPDQMKVGKDFPKTVKHESHVDHELKLVAGREYECDGCDQAGELFAYYCDECDFYLHPKCALELPSPEEQP